MQEIKTYLNRVSPLSDASWNKIVALLTRKTYKAGAYFAQSGRHENSFGIVTDGVLKAWVRNGKGVEYAKTFFTPIHFTTPTAFIGALSALVSNTVNEVEIQALTVATVWEGKYSDWTALYKEHRDIETWSRRMAELFFVAKEKREFEQFTMNADKRYELFKQRYPELEQRIPQYHIAQYLGITPTQLSRIRKKPAA